MTLHINKYFTPYEYIVNDALFVCLNYKKQQLNMLK